jgi:putative transposase
MAMRPASGQLKRHRKRQAPVGAHCHAPLRVPRSLSTLISGFKGSVTRRINADRIERGLSPVVVWQRNYYERIIRDEKELHETQRYIIENPLYWEQDELYKEL